MKKIFLLFGLLISSIVFAHNLTQADLDAQAKDTLFLQLEIEPDSVRLISYEAVGREWDKTYKIILSFLILPMDSCQENYKGALASRSEKNHFTIVYGSPIDAACKQFGMPRTVQHTFIVTENTLFKLNDASFRVISGKKGKLKLEQVL